LNNFPPQTDKKDRGAMGTPALWGRESAKFTHKHAVPCRIQEGGGASSVIPQGQRAQSRDR